ncbi:MAG TPA: PEP-CTERM sorting domain-containing protein [Phycisphaerae bacterium]|jgi:hypothetical protein|nr:PEP-CTERM sorting domain-containing protein [Phycisphaerae bacterium]HOB75846.1 PEP-CTERM sorting domain-containing protein [Phycisphaerae bacterium]HOJ55697.1 PEP-CTERM sorting domain-containing protein [Phycisphaerae bacterium]HOL26679.1 PEP-CTERM sorting domain-containing protein [Phycisphaerae bacterium]HPP20572.1 PEP-CTERM sorting domain-containing protein [Phycisphaerae bacterium]
MRKVFLVCAVGVLAVALPASAATIGPFGTLNGAPAYWTTPVGASNASATIIDTGTGQKLQETPNGNKIEFLPWSLIGSYTWEKTTLAQLDLTGSVDNVHAKVYDPATGGKHGWQIILMDDAGNALAFGVSTMPDLGPGKINGYQYNASTNSWTYPSNYGRNRTGNNYYTLDFVQQGDGTIQWTIDAYENGATWNGTYSTTVSYGAITKVYLAAVNYDNSGNSTNYQWTEFSATPEPATLGLLGLGMLLGLRRRRA